jgi:hypothetical protein
MVSRRCFITGGIFWRAKIAVEYVLGFDCFWYFSFKRFHYESDLMKNTKGHARVVPVFNHSLMQGADGVNKKIHLPKGAVTVNSLN